MKLIDADELKKKAIIHFYTTNYFSHIMDMIDEAPTAEVKPIVDGEWELVDDTFDEMKDYKCNLCG